MDLYGFQDNSNLQLIMAFRPLVDMAFKRLRGLQWIWLQTILKWICLRPPVDMAFKRLTGSFGEQNV